MQEARAHSNNRGPNGGRPNQRPYRSNEPPVRRAPAATTTSGSDPLAELARLIGQTDPFGEFGRDNARRAAAPAPASAAPPAAAKFGADDYFGATTAPAAHPPLPEARAYAAPGAARQPYADGRRARDARPSGSRNRRLRAGPVSSEQRPARGRGRGLLRGCPAAETAHGHHGHRRRICAGRDRHRRRLRLSRAVRLVRSSSRRRRSSRPTPRRARSCRRPPARRPTS